MQQFVFRNDHDCQLGFLKKKQNETKQRPKTKRNV